MTPLSYPSSPAFCHIVRDFPAYKDKARSRPFVPPGFLRLLAQAEGDRADSTLLCGAGRKYPLSAMLAKALPLLYLSHRGTN